MCPDYTTKRCSKCGDELPLNEFQKNKHECDGLQRWCKACRRSHYYDPDRLEKKREYDRHRYNEHAEEFRAYNRDRYHNNPAYRSQEIERGKRKRRTAEHREYERQRHYRRWDNPEFRRKAVDYARNRRRNDPEYRRKVYHWRRARQARIKLQGKPFTHAEWIELCERYDHRCLCCGQRKPLSPDHVIPVSRHGPSDISNIQPLCVDCNKRKSARTTDYRPLRKFGFDEWDGD